MTNPNPIEDLSSLLQDAKYDAHRTPELVAAIEQAMEFIAAPLATLNALGATIREAETEISNQQDEISTLQDRLSSSKTAWSMPVQLGDEYLPDLPVPRLELRIEKIGKPSDGYTWQWRYMLVYRHFLKHIEGRVMGLTRTTNMTGLDDPSVPLETPFRDGAHIYSDAQHLNLPAYITYGDRAEELTERR